MNACAIFRSDLAAFAGGDLAADRAAIVREHLRDCLACRAEAGSLQRAVRTLGALATAPVPGIDDAWFADQQRRIVAAVEREAVEREAVEREAVEQEAVEREADAAPASARWLTGVRWAVPAAAAAGLFLCGWWFVRSDAAGTMLVRPPITTPVSAGPAKAVPWASGGRVQLQPLGAEWSTIDDGAAGGVGPGMMGRFRLRSLEDQELAAPEMAPIPGPGATDPTPPRKRAGR